MFAQCNKCKSFDVIELEKNGKRIQKCRKCGFSTMMSDNIIETVFTLIGYDEGDQFKQSDQLEALYEISTDAQKKAIDNSFICLCGYSLDTIINNPENISKESKS